MLYFSWHRYEHQKFWPQLRESDYDSVGKEKGAGFNINVPWNKVPKYTNCFLILICTSCMRMNDLIEYVQVGMQNSDFLAVFCHVLLPVAYEVRLEIHLLINISVSGIIELNHRFFVPVLPRLSDGVCRL